MDFVEQSASSETHFEGTASETVSTICIVILWTFERNVKHITAKGVILQQKNRVIIKYYLYAAIL